MFERLAGKLLSRLLSKYFVSDDSVTSSSSSPSSWSNLGVWSGYVSLQGLELRKEVVNSIFKSKGLPFELLQCTLERVEITVPWAKLGLSSPSTDGEEAVVVVVVDGVHALLKTNYEFDDEVLREAAIQERRRELLESEAFGKEPETTYSSSMAGFLQKRLADGILKDILEKLHIHVRDVHIRLEDVQSDPANPCAVGVTFESLHVQADDDVDAEMTASPQKAQEAPSGVIRKVAQLNHFAVYWNALEYGEGLPTELSVLQDTMANETPSVLAAALDRCITRRATSITSPLRARPAQTTPNHSFLLLPMDASCNTKLSTNPENLEEKPAMETVLHIDDFSLQIRDFQCSQISILASAVKEHSYTTEYRRYRPVLSAKEDPRAWWRYAFRIVQMELHKGRMRWSWSRFSQRYASRRRYCELYERERRCQTGRDQLQRNGSRNTITQGSLPVVESMSSIPSQDSVSEVSTAAVPIEFGGPSADIADVNEEYLPLTEAEIDELTSLEDGTRGDLSVYDIILFRALVNARIRAGNKNADSPVGKSRLRRLMSSFISEDIESEEEYERLMAYVEQARATQESLVSSEKSSLIAVSIEVNLGRGCISLFSPLRATEDQHQHRRIQQRFLDLAIMRFRVAYSLYGNYESSRIQVSLADVAGSEIRSNHSILTFLSRSSPGLREEPVANGSDSGTPQTSNMRPAKQDFVLLDLYAKPLDGSGCDLRFEGSVQAAEILLLPDNEWFDKIRKLATSKRSARSLSSFWEDIGMAQINSSSSKRASFLAKANTAILAHKNVDIDFHLHCPILRVGDGQGSELTIDPGRAHFVTERLAGVASGKLVVSKARRFSVGTYSDSGQNGDVHIGRSRTPDPGLSTDGSSNSVDSPRRELGDSFFIGGSTMSVIGGKRISTASFYGRVPFGDGDDGSEDLPSRMDRRLHSSFYDEFRLEISSVRMFISEADRSRRSSLLDDMEMHVSIAKSVIPSDHTLCRLRMQCVVQDMCFRLSESSISCLAGLIRNWTTNETTVIGTSSTFYSPSASAREGRMSLRLGLPAFWDDDHDRSEVLSEASSVLDEAEFIDALEGDETDDTPGAWFDDNWIADAESVVDSDIRSVSSRKRGRRKSSMSDVSSISDRSLVTRRRQTNNQYLSAENLAKLEEMVAEEEGGDDGSDADSFQSALSLGGQAALADDVEEHIRRAEQEVEELKRKLSAEAKFADGTPLKIPEARKRSQVRKRLRIDLDRTKAELSALRATHEDLLSQLESAKALHYDEQLDAAGDATGTDENAANALNVRAMALVRARKLRSSSNADEELKHQLTSGLNRELLRASLIFSNVTLVVDGLRNVGDEKDNSQTRLSFEMCMRQCMAGILLRANEMKLSASVDGVAASMAEKMEGFTKRQQLLLGGSDPPFFDSSRDGYNEAVATIDDKVLVITLDRQEKPVAGRLLPCVAQGTKVRILIGEVEVVPLPRSLSSLTKLIQSIRVPKESNNIAGQPKSETDTLLQRLCGAMNGGVDVSRRLRGGDVCRDGKIEYHDLSIRLASLRVTLKDNESSVASLLVCEVEGRFLRASTHAVYTNRSQLDLRCNNVQLFDLYRRPSGLELLGCRDPYNPMAQLRIRSQLVPLTQTGGWVVGDSSESTAEMNDVGELSWNAHLGAKLNSVFATLSPEGLKRVRQSLHTLKGTVYNGIDKSSTAVTFQNGAPILRVPSMTSVQQKDISTLDAGDAALDVPIRWRFDFVAKKISALFPSSSDVNEIEASHPHLAKSNALLSFSLHSWMQAAPRRADSLFVRSSFSDISLTRTSDDWPLLETTSMVSDVDMIQKKIVNGSCQLRLTVPDTFSWSGNRSLSVGSQADGPGTDAIFTRDVAVSASLAISPLRFNVAAQTGALLLAVVECAETLSRSDEGVNENGTGNEETDDAESSTSHEIQENGCYVKVSTESIELKMLRESERSTSVSFADPLASMVALQVNASISRSMGEDEFAFGIRELSLYDLSSLPGARVFGLDRGHEHTQDSLVCVPENDGAEETQQLLLLQLSRSRAESPTLICDIHLGKMQCLVIPSFLGSLLSFRKDMRALKSPTVSREDRSLSEEGGSELTIPFGVHYLEFSLRVAGFECLLPSRDIFSYIRSRSKEPVNVVAFRWRSMLTVKVSRPSNDAFDFSMVDSFSVLNEYEQDAGCVLVESNLSVEDFQVLRTNVKRRPFPRSAAGGPHISPCSFMVNPPVAGEQRITNPFWFRVSYQFSAVSDFSSGSFDGSDIDGTYEAGIYFASQALQIQAGFVDILVYIKQSAGGMNDAVRVTVKPIMDMLKQKDDAEKSKADQERSSGESSKLSRSLKSATTVFSLHSEGIQVTCVPGGATRLTESPIAKCELSNLKLAVAGVTLPTDQKIAFGSTTQISAIERLRQAGLERIGVVEPTVSGGTKSHMTLGGWMRTELSASYHNRRLVAWEPLIEPWVVNVRSGIDMVRAFNMSATPWLGGAGDISQSDGANESAGERIRDIGRLLRASFSPNAGETATGVNAGSHHTLSPFNLSYAMMKSISPEVVESAFYPTDRKALPLLNVLNQKVSLYVLPGTSPAKWLELFGHPPISTQNENSAPTAFVLSISDSRPLNMNLTGALIENLLSFFGGRHRESIHPTAPHVIRNFSGLTIRFQECLSNEQIGRGELAKKSIVQTGSEIPLTLKRSLSQSCDPHKAYISLELGSFEDTAGRLDHNEFEVTSRSRATTFFYKAVGRIPVDTVGVRKYALCHRFKRRADGNSDLSNIRQDVGYVIVRVDLQGSTKLVSIESPLVLKNNSEVDLLCELRNHGGISLLWRSLVPRASTPMSSEKTTMVKKKYISVPADLVSTASSSEATLSVRAVSVDSSITHESDVPREAGDKFVAVDVPPPFSDKSVARGLIKVFETTLDAATSVSGRHSLNTCALRIGSVARKEDAQSESQMEPSIVVKQVIPEQRMLFFRPPIVVRNHLPVTISVQGRVNRKALGMRRRLSNNALGISERFNQIDVATTNNENNPSLDYSAEWNDLGILECGKSLSWTGATAAEEVEIRIRISSRAGEPSRKFPEWSTLATVPSQTNAERSRKPGVSHTTSIGQMMVHDDAGVSMQVSLSLEFGSNMLSTDSMPRHDVCWFSRTLPAAPRVVGVFVPFWIIDSTGQDLEFLSNSTIAGQSFRCSEESFGQSFMRRSRLDNHAHLGLAELLEDDSMKMLSTKNSLDVLMIGDRKSSRLSVRRRVTHNDGSSVMASSWCDPLALRVRHNTFTEVIVPAPFLRNGHRSEDLEPLALGVRVLSAPEDFGGMHGTKLVHISCRYRIVNEMGREIEVISDYGSGRSSTFGVDGKAAPFHFNGTSPIRFRPKEFGWRWSGRFSLRKKRQEVTMRLVHKLRGEVIIAEVEFVEAGKSGGHVLVFREALHPPFRIENQTMHPIHFTQSLVLFGAERGQMPVSLDSTILPYHYADFAWDNPDERRRSLAIELADFGNTSRRHLIGRFKLDRVAPGNRIRLADSDYFGHIVADGPTRVLRITEASLPMLPTNEVSAQVSSQVFSKPETSSGLPSLIELRLNHGLGISVVDWAPQELLYIKLDEIVAERRLDATHEHVTCNVSYISVDNQMWVTPFPVLLRMGRRTRNLEKVRRRRNNAISTSWRRALNAQSGLILLDNFELLTEPIILCVDGFLAERCWNMARHVMGMSDLIGGAAANVETRDSKLRKVLHITGDQSAASTQNINQGNRLTYGDNEGDEAFLATTVVAAKLRMRPRSESIVRARANRNLVSKQQVSQSLNQRDKYYVGKLKVSTLKTEISWSGPLPAISVKFPEIMRPALTFESLPVMLRPFSISHSYGTSDDLAHSFKSHYLSFWRVVDVLFGLTFRPTFLLRACIYTWRESCASVFESISNSLGDIEKGLIRLAEPEPTTLPQDDKAAVVLYASQAYQSLVGGSLVATASVFHNSARMTLAFSNSLRYGGSARNPASRSVRVRNPRLFAHVEGKELLVEYVEGENAGKAILSRVRMGRHLGEGLVFYCEGIRLQSDATPADSTPLICVVTSERVFLLNGNRDENFCSVVWESTFLNLVEVEYDSTDTPFDLVKLWYLVDTAHLKGNDDKLTRYSKAIVSDADFGLDILLCKSILVPKESGSTLRSKIATINRRLEEAGRGDTKQI